MKKHVLVGMMVLALAVVQAPAQTKVGTTVGQFLMIEPSARVAGMGNAGVTTYEEIQSAYFNPAAIGHMEHNGVQFTHSPWLADITYDYVGGVLTMGDFGNLYGSVTSLNSGDIEVRTISQPLGTGEKYTVGDISFSLGYGKRISDRFSVGLQATYMQERVWHSSISAMAVSIGTLYQISENGFRLAASISNWGTRARYDGRDLRILFDQNTGVNGDNSQIPAELLMDEYPLPILFRVGVGMPFIIDENNRLQVAVDAFHPSDNTESVSVGAEWLFFDTFALRGGYQNLFLQDSEVGLTLGAGLRYEANGLNLLFDYAWADYGRLDKVQRLTLGVMF
jgi:hypothetical protein